ncbi:aromatic amino acid lyase, partial [Candidatus Microgenomates bacterium]|nr:aromatic amino acid lyase [Candidatus Microgenomates bacterium]
MGEPIDYNKKTLVEIDRLINRLKKEIVLTGKNLSIAEIVSSFNKTSKIRLTQDKKILARIKKSIQVMLENVIEGIPVYGTNSSFGGQAARILNKGEIEERLENARKISEGLVFLDVGVGPELLPEIVRAAMTIRINMLMQGVSAVRLETLKLFKTVINKNIIPVVNSYGGIGASGDLTHNQRVVSALRGLPGVKVINEKGKIEEARSVLTRNEISLLELDPKEGLALVNGDNFSTSYATYVVRRLLEYFLIGEVVGAMAIEVLKGTNRSFHPLLASVRPHPGQKESADTYRYLLSGSKLAYQELEGHKLRPNGIKVQDGYSLRALSQFEGVMIEKIKWALNVITVNANSVSDNPLWVPDELVVKGEDPWQWVSGGNFLAMHMVEVMDTLRKIITQLVKRNDRHLARMIDTSENNGLPPNLSNGDSITHCTFKGVQIQSGMFEIYSMILASPVSILFGTHEERNQDITSHALTSGILALKNLELLKYSLVSNLLAVAQGVDLRGGAKLLSPRTRPMYEFIRSYSKPVKEDRPLYHDIKKLADTLEDGVMMGMVRKKIFAKI